MPKFKAYLDKDGCKFLKRLRNAKWKPSCALLVRAKSTIIESKWFQQFGG